MFWQGVRAMLLVAAGVATYGVVFGSLAAKNGFSLPETLGMSTLIYSGSAQLVALPLIQAGAPVLGIVITVLAMSLRHVVMGISLGPQLRHIPVLQRLLLAYAVNDETYAVIWGHARQGGLRPSYMAGAALTTMLAWIGSSALGHLLGAVLPSPESLGLDFAFTALFIALLVPQVRSTGGMVAVVSGGAASLLCGSWLGMGLGVAIGGLVGALVGGFVED